MHSRHSKDAPHSRSRCRDAQLYLIVFKDANCGSLSNLYPCLTHIICNLLAGNLKKYQVLHLGFTQNDSNICVNDVVIETKDNIILLGVVLDSKLNFSEHINSICKKASRRIGVLMRLRNLIPMKSKLILFKSAILPFLT